MASNGRQWLSLLSNCTYPWTFAGQGSDWSAILDIPFLGAPYPQISRTGQEFFLFFLRSMLFCWPYLSYGLFACPIGDLPGLALQGYAFLSFPPKYQILPFGILMGNCTSWSGKTAYQNISCCSPQTCFPGSMHKTYPV